MSFLLIVFIISAPVYAQDETSEDDIDDEYDLIMENTKGLTFIADEDTPNVVTQEEMEREGAKDLWEAIRNVPGVIMSGGGARNDSSFTVRGFDSASMPIYVDGVTTADPFRGSNDAARLLTGDLESIKVEKGFSSMLLGSNTMGGAIIIKTARPKSPFEASLQNTTGLDILGKFADNTSVLSIGGRQKLFYAKTTFQYRGVDHFRIPDSFTPMANNPQDRGDRLWSNSNDIKLTMLAGLTPLDDLDISLSWVFEDSNKGFSPPSVNGRDYYIWQWPRYDRQNIVLNAQWTPENFNVELNSYFSKFDNRMIEYPDWISYENKNYYKKSYPSDYDDWTTGFRLSGGWEINSWNKVDGAVNFRMDEHKGLYGEQSTLGIEVNEDTVSLGAEWTTRPWKPFRFVAGIGWDAILPNLFWGKDNELNKELGFKYIEKTKSWKLLAMEAGVFYELSLNHTLHFTYARKNHFPTMSQRYSTRSGESKANPNLGPEFADHFELGYKGVFFKLLKLNTAAYFSNVIGKIVQIPVPVSGGGTVPYPVNLDNTAMWGLEAGIECNAIKQASFGGTFSFNEYSIFHTELEVKAIPYYPAITAAAYSAINPAEGFSVIPSCQYVGSRWADGQKETELDGYFLFNLKAEYAFNLHFSVSFSVNNIFDTLYEISAYFPMPGRTYDISVTAKY